MFLRPDVMLPSNQVSIIRVKQIIEFYYLFWQFLIRKYYYAYTATNTLSIAI